MALGRKIVLVVSVGALVSLGVLGLGFTIWFGSADQAEFVLTADRIPRDQVVADATANLTDGEEAVVAEAVRNGSATTVGTRLEIDGAYVAHNGSLYRANVTDGRDVRGERFVVFFTPVDGNHTDARPVNSLSDTDITNVEHAYRHLETEDRQETSRFVYRDRKTANESVLVGGNVQYVRMRNETFRVNVTRQSVELEIYQYALTRVAANETAAVELLVHDATEELSDEQTRPIAEAVETGEFRTRGSTFETAWQPLEPIAELCDVEPQDFVNRDRTACYVRFEGEIYRLVFDGRYSFD